MAELWIPKDVEDLENAVNSKSVVENSYLDFKAFSNEPSKDLAKLLAALSLEGGVVIFGVDEDKQNGCFKLAPGPLVGQRERISIIGLQAVQPAVRLETRALEREDGTGYLIVIVPASPRAPHMAKNTYYFRSDTTNSPMTDSHVRSIWLRNLDRRDDAIRILRREVAREFTPTDRRAGARLFVVAQPVSADSRLLLDSIPDRNMQEWARRIRDGRTLQWRGGTVLR